VKSVQPVKIETKSNQKPLEREAHFSIEWGGRKYVSRDISNRLTEYVCVNDNKKINFVKNIQKLFV
jgi:hypothetical protein